MTLKRFPLMLFTALAALALARDGHCAADADASYKQAYAAETVDRDPAKAIALYKRVLSQTADENPLAAKAHLRLGMCYEKLGKTAEARLAYQDVLDMPEAPQAVVQQAREHVQRLQPVVEKPARIVEAPSVSPPEAGHLVLFPAEDPEEAPRFHLAAYGGKQVGMGDFHASEAVVAMLGFSFNRYISLDLQSSWMGVDQDVKVFGENVPFAHRDMITVELVPKVSFPIGAFKPYFAAGPGIFFLNNGSRAKEFGDIQRATAQLMDEQFGPGSFLSTTDYVKNTLGAVLGGGIDVAITKRISFGIDVAYLYIRPWERTTSYAYAADQNVFVSDAPEGADRKLDTIRAVAGIKVKF